MNSPSRRSVLGSAGAIGLGTTLGLTVPVHAAESPGQGPAFDTAPARAALNRLLPGHADQFRLTLVRREGTGDRFRVSGGTGRVQVQATTPATLLMGVHWYLKYVCGAHLAWNGSQLDLPRRLPAPARPLERSTALPHRFALNDTNDGYTAPYADWPYWERQIDLLAAHGCNEVLVIAGTEAVYHRLLKDFGYSDEESRAWLPAPSHQPWWLLQNLSGYGGPLSPELIDRRAALGRRIADRLRELGMSPVLPGYYGHVPKEFVERNGGDAHVVPQGVWHGFERPDWLDPRTDSFAKVAASFYGHQEDVFGEAAHFKMDLLHEGGTAGDVPVPGAAQGVERALQKARPGATWVILGWQENPLPELLDAIDKSRMLIVDGVSDRYTSVTDRERDWGGTPYCFGTIPNFGGRTTIGARAHIWNEKFFAWRDKANSALAGTAFMPEATDRDPAAFELFSELAWTPTKIDRAAWFSAYADYRYGARDDSARRAWRALHDTAYQQRAVERSDPHDSLFCARPDLAADRAAEYAPRALTYDPGRFDAALAGLLGVAGGLRGSAAYKYDVVDVARQALAHRSRQYLPQLRAAYQRKDLATFRALSTLWLRLMRLSDEVTGANSAFLLGPWVNDARLLATNDAERAEFERTAKVLITVWGGRATSDAGDLHEYGNREWHGLMADFYVPRWEKWLDTLEDALATGTAPAAVDWFAFEEPWTRERKDYALRPVGDAYALAGRVREVLARAPYQGALAVSADPAVLPPGGSARVSAEFRNVNGLRATGRVDFALSGFDGTVEAEGPTSIASVPAAGVGTVRWRADAPGVPLDRPLRPHPYTITVEYGPRGEERVSSAFAGTLFEAGPLGAEWSTYSNNDAVFGQLGDRFAIDGAGTDLWRGTAEFGAVYREGVFRDGGSVTLRVDSQAVTGNWARAGIVVRNSLGTAGAPGFLNLAVTPANGVVLSYDSTGDGTLDTYRRITGIKAPVLLRLTRAASGSYTGECSTDEGVSWRVVATVTVPGAAAGAQDVGLFMSATNGGSGVRGLVEFSGWELT
ncbi:alpha-N-acetylglucosaminidase TIM-barrel domain-containing protein [Streptomyces ipomoeae]|uniref:Tat pathway signal sequence domain protein n=3 Tax=Streptomyces ipomoeae TaxID=103232 RepID=L1KNN5_9ACTN|nr:alpha-N-acetylglucosaminidase TIM-barrel domain-containing protein [Streptomyces ipomoeae]EKX62401.1 Tat pathway signal sequence domain protein [Streptomyces ipomoeae 91-03]